MKPAFFLLHDTAVIITITTRVISLYVLPENKDCRNSGYQLINCKIIAFFLDSLTGRDKSGNYYSDICALRKVYGYTRTKREETAH